MVCGAALALAFAAAGCMRDRPPDSDVPWSTPQSWEGTIPLPSSFQQDGM